MKRFLFSTFAALMLTATGMQAADGTVPHRKVYGYFNYNGVIADGSYGFGSFYLDELDKAEIIYPYGDEKSIYAGACVDDMFYAYEYEYNPIAGAQNGSFISYNVASGRYTALGTEGLEQMGASFKPQDMTYDYNANVMYAVGFSQGESAIYEVNLTNGIMTKKVTLQTTVGVIAADYDGTVYAVGANDGVLYRVNMDDGSLEKVVETGFGGLMYNQTMEFDHSTGKLYWAANSYDYDGAREAYMLCIDVHSDEVAIENLGKIGSGATFMAMYIPFAEGGDDAPAAPSDLTVVPGTNGARSASLSWTLPETTFGGEVLTNGLTGIVIERNGEVIATLPGYATEYDDESVTEDGEYEYVVYATNALGNGGKARVFSFIGNDMPDKVGNIRFTVGDACASAILSWTAPTKGFNGGYFSEDGLTYRIVRMPDNKTVAEGLTETTFTDTSIGRLGRYTYVIYACNAYGETAADASESYVLGDALDLPVTQDFSNLSYFENQWMAYDGNDDKYSWNYSSEWGYYQFGDATPCAEYIINPGIDNPGNDADEWLVTPPLAFDAKKQYCMKLTVRCTTDETLKLTVGNNNVMTGHEEFGEIILKPVVDDDKYGISEYEVNLPAGIDGVKCIGLHLASPYPAEGFSYLQIMNVTIDEGQATGMSSAVTDNAGRTDDNNVYTLDGRLVRTDGSLDGLAKGVYVKGGRKYVVK